MTIKARSEDGISRPSWPIAQQSVFQPLGPAQWSPLVLWAGPRGCGCQLSRSLGQGGEEGTGGTWPHSVSWPPALDLTGQPEDRFFLHQGFCPRPGPSLGLEEPRLHRVVFLPTRWAVWWEAVGSADGSWCPGVAKVP